MNEAGIVRVFSFADLKWIALLLLVSFAVQAKPLTVAIVPQFTTTQTFQKWQPLLDQLSKQTGLSFKLKVYNNFPDFERDYLQGEPDLVYYNPYHQVKGHLAQGYVPLVRDGKRKLTGIIVVGRDSPYQQLDDLDGKTFSFPAPNAFAASLYMRALLTEKEALTHHTHYSGSHSNSYRDVVAGRAEAAGGVFRSLKKQPKRIRDQLRVIYQTPGNSPHPLSAHRRVNKKSREKITQAILLMNNDPAGKAILQNIQMSHPVKASHLRDYQPLNRLGLEKYHVSGK
ncbi:MAG: phosphate/phosphite/phosphonate ABC transporter substrate-binding protein [Gammaproteobacteria bacterium]|nr:phosphate/phosphite/phosphonate ABC transporter substrate-binding protein [Gammaproteobacteria bacterium]